MITKKEANRYKTIVEDGTYYDAINTMLGLHLRITAIIREALQDGTNNNFRKSFSTQIRDLWEDVTMNVDYNESDQEDRHGNSQLSQIALKLAMSELMLLGYKCNDAKDFLQYDNENTLSIRLF